MPTAPLQPIATLGIDIGKNSFHLIGLDERGAIVLRQKLSRGQVEQRLANMPTCLIGLEACVGAHHLSRQLLALGHDVKLIPAQFVSPFRKSHKNDFRDAEAIAEAVLRPTMRFVPTKTVEQLDLQALHRVRSRLVSQRTAVINQIRAFLLERGIAVDARSWIRHAGYALHWNQKRFNCRHSLFHLLKGEIEPSCSQASFIVQECLEQILVAHLATFEHQKHPITG